eukprot:4111258-Prymnesium_polylepis.2
MGNARVALICSSARQQGLLARGSWLAVKHIRAQRGVEGPLAWRFRSVLNHQLHAVHGVQTDKMLVAPANHEGFGIDEHIANGHREDVLDV